MFIGEKLGVDMLRAAAYHYANVHPQRERTQLHVLAIQRKGKRKIVNFDTLVKEMSKIEETTLRKVMLEEYMKERRAGSRRRAEGKDGIGYGK